MKIHYLLAGALMAIVVSCNVENITDPSETDETSYEETTFYATIDDQPGNAATKTFTNETLRVFWNKDDRITVFNNVTGGLEFTFQGEDQDAGGTFKKTNQDEFAGGEDLGGYKYAIYPHQSGTKISHDGIISYTIPAVQAYKPGSFGRGDNAMVAKTNEDVFRFKNLGGYLVFKLYGDDVSVSSVVLKGNNNERLAGPCSVDMSSGLPAVTMDPEASVDEITLECAEPVSLGKTAEEYTEFWFVLPPVEFSKDDGGFTLTVYTSDGGVFVKPAPIDLSIQRNNIRRIAPLEVIPVSLNVDSSIKIRGISSAKNHKTELDESTHTFTVTLPTVTDFSELVLNYDIEDGDLLMADGVAVENGVTPVDATKPVSLIVRRGNSIMRYSLIARNTGLPVVRITTSGFTLNDIESYENPLQSADGTDHRVWLPEVADAGTFVCIEYPDGTPGMNQIKKDGSIVPVNEVITQIKGRGNYTWKWDKKPYALKFDSKREVLGMPAHKRWVLLANWRDRTLLRNDAAFWLSKEAGMPYTTRGQFVELEINGEHRGNYYLCEQVKIDENRVNITPLDADGFADLSGGYLMEIDSYWDELNKFKSAEFNLNYMFKEPDDDPNDPSTDPGYASGYAWMENYINEFEKVLKTKSGVANHLYENYLDVDSAIWFMLLNELTGNRDFFQGQPNYGPHSTYLYKDKGGKLVMGPIWDFDYETFIPASYYSSWGSSGFKWRGFDNTGYYYYFLCYDQQFVDRIKALWNSKKAAFAGLTAYIDTMAANITLSQQFDECLWPFHNEENRNDNHDYTLSFVDAIARMKTSFNAKLEWMDSEINSLSRTSPKSFKYK